MSQRTDVHSPTHLDPAAYEYSGSFDSRPDPIPMPGSSEALYVASLRSELGARGIGGNWSSKGTCDHCGVSIRYVVVLRHESGSFLAVGEQCAAERFDLPDKMAWDLKRLRSVAKDGRQSAKRKDQIEAFFTENPDLRDHMTFPISDDAHHIVASMAHQLKKNGSLSEKQAALARRLVVQQREWVDKRAAEKADATPVVEGKQIVEGVLVTTKWAQGYGPFSDDVLKMVVKDDRGFKVYGSVPASLFDYVIEEMKGQRLRFTASLERSHDDETFGFFKRPSKAEWMLDPESLEQVAAS